MVVLSLRCGYGCTGRYAGGPRVGAPVAQSVAFHAPGTFGSRGDGAGASVCQGAARRLQRVAVTPLSEGNEGEPQRPCQPCVQNPAGPPSTAPCEPRTCWRTPPSWRSTRTASTTTCDGTCTRLTPLRRLRHAGPDDGDPDRPGPKHHQAPDRPTELTDCPPGSQPAGLARAVVTSSCSRVRPHGTGRLQVSGRQPVHCDERQRG